ncbi:MAG: hypothetical protein IPK85_00760 [Gemmatimonadetes bacterium]|nr:hypothetical protein [Gemmatimonadota bacterium]
MAVVEGLELGLPSEAAVERRSTFVEGLKGLYRRSGKNQDEGAVRTLLLPNRIEL